MSFLPLRLTNLMRTLLLLSLLPFGLGACCGLVSQTVQLEQWLLKPLSPAEMGLKLNALQQLTASHNGEQHNLQIAVQSDHQQLLLAALGPMGQRLFSLTQQADQVLVKRHPQLPEQLQPEQILRDFQLVYAPAAALRARLPAGWSLQADPRQRRLLQAQTLVAEVTYLNNNLGSNPGISPQASQVQLTNHVFGYALQIDTMVIQ